MSIGIETASSTAPVTKSAIPATVDKFMDMDDRVNTVIILGEFE
jgi:hypothetical protein